MTNRTFPPYTPQQSPAFGLVGWLEQTRVHLPLKGVECQFHVCGDLLRVEIDQIFHQNAAQAMDCLYSFPLPAGAAIYRCEMHVNGRVIRARVEEQEQARKIAIEQKAAGRRTALVEMERDNLFTLSLGNLQPGDVVVIRFGYFETLTRLADWTSLRIPFCPGVRYIPGEPLLRSLRGKGNKDDTNQVPDASRISPPRIEAFHPDAASLSVQGVIENGLETVPEVSSPSHPVVTRDGDRQCSVTLAQQSAVPDCDFVLRWTESRRETVQTAAWVERTGAESYALVRLQAPQVPAGATRIAQDFYFLVDRSGSMEGLKWSKAVQAFRAFLDHLGPEDRAWVTFFNDQQKDFAEKPMTAAQLIADRGLASLERLGAAGGTEMLPAMEHVLKAMAKHSAGRETALILITDGQVGNEAALLASCRSHPDLRVHAFGIDTAVNDALLARLAAQQRGSSCLMQPTDDIVGAVKRLGERLGRPVLTSVMPCDGWEVAGASVPDLHAEESLSISLKTSSADAREVVFTGRLPDGRVETFRFPLVERTEPAIRLLWASGRIRRLLNEAKPGEAVALAKQHNLLCEGAAFIAWDEAERVPIAQLEVYQPCLAVEDVHFGSSMPACASAGKMPLSAGARPPRVLREHRSYLIEPEDHGRIVEQPHDAFDQQLQAIIAARPHLDSRGFLKRFAGPLLRCCVRLSESRTLPREVQDARLIGLLVEWVVDGESDAARRMKCLEELVETLETEATTPEIGLAHTLQWVAQSFLPQDGYRERIETILKDIVERVVEVRERERKSGQQTLKS